MKKVFQFLILLSIAHPVSAQQKITDSLKSVLAGEKNDSVKIKLMENLSYNFQYTNFDSAYRYAMNGLSLAKRTNNIHGKAICLNALGNVFHTSGNELKGLQYYIESLKLREEMNDAHGIAVVTENIGGVFARQKDFPNAILYMKRAMRMDDSLHDEEGLLIDELNLAETFNTWTKFDSAMKYVERAELLAEKISDEYVTDAIFSLRGQLAFREGNFDVAEKYYRNALKAAMKIDDNEITISTLGYLANCYSAQSKTDSAIVFYRQSIQISQTAALRRTIPETAKSIALLYQKIHQPDSANKYLSLALEASDSLMNTEKISEINNMLFNERVRQDELTAEREAAENTRRNFLQYLGIAVFIISFVIFLFTLSRRKMSRKALEFLSTMALLLFFQFILLLIGGLIEKISEGIPVVSLVCWVVVAASLIPLDRFLSRIIDRKITHKHQPA